MSNQQDVETGTTFTSVQPQKSSAYVIPSTGHRTQPVDKGWIILSFCCCHLFGLLALFYNRKAVESYANHDYSGGADYASKARFWTWTGIIVGSIVTLAALGGFGYLIYVEVQNTNDSVNRFSGTRTFG